MNFVDLHCHTTASDGTLTPTQLVARAVEFGLKTIAVTDHDTTDGVAEAVAAGEKAEAFFNVEVRKGDQIMIDAYKKANVEVVEMSKADYDAWLAIAKQTSYKNFAEKVPGGDKLIEKALAVQ